MNRFAGVLGAVALLLAGAWAARRAHLAELTPHLAGGTPPAAASATRSAGEADPPDVALEPGLSATRSIPELLPEFTLADLRGHATAISTWQGKSLILNFWATWCAPCRREMPLLQKLDHDWSGGGFRVIGIAVDHPEAVARFAKSLQIDYPLLVGEEDALDVAASLGVTSPAFPFTAFTDRRGQIVALYIGELHQPQSDLILTAVTQVNEDRLAVTLARQQIAAELAKMRSAPSG